MASVYSRTDLSESLQAARREGHALVSADIARVVAAHGEGGDYSEWSGGFLLQMRDGSYVYLTGWCDTTGWGCQDGCSVTRYDDEPALNVLAPDIQWDLDPSDLNRWLAEGAQEY